MPSLINRRQWLKSSSLIALAPTIPAFLRTSLRAAEPNAKQRILVVIQLDGGNDGINTVVPHADEGYAKYRRELKLPMDRLIKVNDQVALHPSLKSAASLLEDGRLAIVQGVGYPNPNRSHDVSMAIWQTARMDPADHNSFGWIGRTMDQSALENTASPRMMLVGDSTPPVAIRGRKSAYSALNHLHDLHRKTVRPSNQLNSRTDESSNANPIADDLSAFVRRTTLDAYATADVIAENVGKTQSSPSGYPATELARRLQMIGQLIKADIGTSAYYTVQSGYDTHSVQLPAHARLLGEFSNALKAFLDDLKAASLDDRVLVLCFSEFGRRVAENASQGTDHGTSGPVFIAGSNVKAGLHGSTPSLTDLEQDDLKLGFDFRQVYGTVLERWLNVKIEPILGSTFEPIAFL